MFVEIVLSVALIIGLGVLFGLPIYGICFVVTEIRNKIRSNRRTKERCKISSDYLSIGLCPRIVEGEAHLTDALYSCETQEQINAVKEWGKQWNQRMKTYYTNKGYYHPEAVKTKFNDSEFWFVEQCIDKKWKIFENTLKNE